MSVTLNVQELEERIRNLKCISGTVYYDLIYRNVKYKVKNHDTISYDRIQERDNIPDKCRGTGGLTYIQALKNLYRQGVPSKDWRGVDTACKPRH